jgi:LysM repeat protein
VNAPRTGATVSLVMVLVVLASGCQPQEVFAPPAGESAQQRAYRPPMLSIYEVTGGESAGAAQLAAVLQGRVLPSEVVIGSLATSSSSVTIYTVRRGDSLAAIASAHQLTLSALEAANAALGPAGGRSWDLVRPGDRVTIPDPQTTEQAPVFVVKRLPAGPTPPSLLVPPSCPANTTSFLRAECANAARKDRQLNEARKAAWWASEDEHLRPARSELMRSLQGIAAAPRGGVNTARGGAVFGGSIQVAANALGQLPARRVLLVSEPGDGGPPALQSGELAGIHLVVTGVTDPSAEAGWTMAGKAAGAASAVVLSPALTQLALAAAVNGVTSSG